MGMSKPETRAAAAPQRWLLLLHQLPAKPSYLRVKIWRRLQGIGAVAVKNAVYALPAGDQAQEDFDWVLKEITEAGGEALICEARLIDGLTDDAVKAQFNAARELDYEGLAKEVRLLGKSLRKTMTNAQRLEAKGRLARLKSRQAEIVNLDFFGAVGREAVDGLLAGLEARLAEDVGEHPAAQGPKQIGREDLRDRVWVTRQGVFIDRIACAWLIRRFIDPAARFKFVPPKGYVPEKGELRFDMFEAEFTHEGDRCSFEVILERSALKDQALQAIAEIVHDIDLKDEKFGRSESAGVRTLFAGVALAQGDDGARIAAGSVILDNLYAYFRRKRG
jgi:hypothetical protein